MRRSVWIVVPVILSGCAQMTDVKEPESQADIITEQEASCDAQCREVLDVALNWVSQKFNVRKSHLIVDSNVDVGPGPQERLDPRTVTAFARAEGVPVRSWKDIKKCDESRLLRRSSNVNEGRRGPLSMCYLTEGRGLVTFLTPRTAEDGSITIGVTYFGQSEAKWPDYFYYVEYFLTLKEQNRSWAVTSVKMGAVT